jgi:transposase
MRGCDEMQESLFTVAELEDFVPENHPLRALRELVNEALQRLNELFSLGMLLRGVPRLLRRS